MRTTNEDGAIYFIGFNHLERCLRLAFLLSHLSLLGKRKGKVELLEF